MDILSCAAVAWELGKMADDGGQSWCCVLYVES